jgi:hypothetical protein
VMFDLAVTLMLSADIPLFPKLCFLSHCAP